MAITIHQQPAAFSLSGNPLVYVAESDNNTESNFSVVFDVYLEGIFYSRHKIPVRPSSSSAVFDATGLISDVTNAILPTFPSGWVQQETSLRKVQVKIGEEYDVSGSKTVFLDLALSNNISVVLGQTDHLFFVDYDPDTYLLNESGTFLTNAPLNQTMIEGSKAFLYYITNAPTVPDRLRVREYDESGALLATNHVANPDKTDDDLNRFKAISVGHGDLSTLIGGFPNANMAYYDVAIVDISDVVLSEVRTYTMICEAMYTPVTLHFANPLGGFDSLIFPKVSVKRAATGREFYTQNLGELDDIGQSYDFSKSDRGKSVVKVESDLSKRCNSDFLTDDQFEWLYDLITSPLAFEQQGSDLIPVNITNTNYEFIKRVNGRLEGLAVEFDYSNSLIR